MKSIRSRFFRPILAGVLGFGALATYGALQSPTDSTIERAMASVLTTKPAPDFALKDVNGKIVRLSDYRGKVVVLNFWATWSEPSRKEIPDFNALQQAYAGKVQFLSIALDDQGLSKVKPFVAANPIDYPVLLPDASIKAYGEMTSIPMTFVIDSKGMISQSYIGARQKAVLEGFIKPLIH